MFKFKPYTLILFLAMIPLLSGACAESPAEDLTATPLEVPKEVSPGEYINVIIQVASDKPCKLVLSTPHKTEIDNYLAPHTSDTLTYPNSGGTIAFHERIPWETVPVKVRPYLVEIHSY